MSKRIVRTIDPDPEPQAGAVLTLTGPTTGGANLGLTKTFTVTPDIATTDTVSYNDGGNGGVFNPPSATGLSWAAVGGAKTFTYSNANPGVYPISITSSTGNTIAGSPINLTLLTYTLSGPLSCPVNVTSAPITITPSGLIPGDTLTLSDNGQSGVFIPPTLTWTNSAAGQSFTYKPVSIGNKQMRVSSSSLYTIPNFTLANLSTTSFTLVGPATGSVGDWSDLFTVTPDQTANESGPLSDGGASGQFLPTNLNFPNNTTPRTFRYRAASPGQKQISYTTNKNALVNGTPFVFTAGRPVVTQSLNPIILNDESLIWYLIEPASGKSVNYKQATGSFSFNPTSSGINGILGPTKTFAPNLNDAGEWTIFDLDPTIAYRVLVLYPDDINLTTSCTSTLSSGPGGATLATPTPFSMRTAAMATSSPIGFGTPTIPSSGGSASPVLKWHDLTPSSGVTPNSGMLTINLKNGTGAGDYLALNAIAIQPFSKICPPAPTYSVTPQVLTAGQGSLVRYIVKPAGPGAGNITLTPNSGSPLTKALPGDGRPLLFDFYPTVAGAFSVVPTNTAGLTDPTVTGVVITPRSGLFQTGNGLLLQNPINWFDQWKSTAPTTSYTVTYTKTVVAFDPLPRVYLTKAGINEQAGVREATPYVESTDAWYLGYDSGAGTNGTTWRMMLKKSINRGVSFAALGNLPAVNTFQKFGGGTWQATAFGMLHKRGSNYYLHQVTTDALYGTPNFGLPAPPYSWQILKSDTANLDTTTWTPQRIVPPATYTGGTANELVPGSTVPVAGTFHHFGQIGVSGQYLIGRFTATAEEGPYTYVETIYDQGGTVENPKANYHAWMDCYFVMGNDFQGGTAKVNWILCADSITGFGLNTTAGHFMHTSVMLGQTAIGVPTPFTGPEGALIVEPNGFFPIAWDGNPGTPATPHLDRDIRLSICEPSLSALGYVFGSVDHRWADCIHTDIVIEEQVLIKLTGTTSWEYRTDGTGPGYRVTLGASGLLNLYKCVDSGSGWPGTPTLLSSTNTGTTQAASTNFHALKISASGTTHKAWLNGEQHYNLSDSTYTSGTRLVHSGTGGQFGFRNFSARTSDTVTITSLPASNPYVVRAAGDVPAFTGATSAAGVATIVHTHSPLKGIDIGLGSSGSGDALPPTLELWGGSSFDYVAQSDPIVPTVPPVSVSLLPGSRTPADLFSCASLQPTGPADLAVEQPVNFAANLQLRKGTIVGQIATAANDVQTLSCSYTPTGGALTLQGANLGGGGVSVLLSMVAGSITAPAAQGAAQVAFGSGNVLVTGGPFPASPLVFTFAGAMSNRPLPLMTIATNALTGGTPGTVSIAHTTTGATPGTYRDYAPGNLDGSQNARGITQFDLTTDANGTVILGAAAVGNARDSYPQAAAPIFIRGTFLTQDLIGLDAGAVSSLGRIVQGTITTGRLQVK